MQVCKDCVYEVKGKGDDHCCPHAYGIVQRLMREMYDAEGFFVGNGDASGELDPNYGSLSIAGGPHRNNGYDTDEQPDDDRDGNQSGSDEGSLLEEQEEERDHRE